MRKLNWSLKALCDRNKDGAYATQAARRRVLQLVANQLHELNYRRISNANNLKPKHVYALVQHWSDQGLSNATMKNRLSHLRWLAEKTNNRSLVKRNDDYGIARREYIGHNRSLEFTDEKMNRIQHEHVRCAALLQREFGLRREEALKFKPSMAHHATHIKIYPSWAKGGRGREVPILFKSQEEALRQAHAVAGSGSLIPADKTYRQFVKIFEKEMLAAGLGKSHGARHHYAQMRYEQLTGFQCVANGGLPPSKMHDADRQKDEAARQVISRELGHERKQIVSVYLGG
ncbi:hypothetical protein AB833_13950 [Chromatiales bacterium (ex Bugula neritina AB1)]|nr:hypothetical protein AB833_13950 [Chromatiales bacterium (ex Bugula neritina AB1)]